MKKLIGYSYVWKWRIYKVTTTSFYLIRHSCFNLSIVCSPIYRIIFIASQFFFSCFLLPCPLSYFWFVPDRQCRHGALTRSPSLRYECCAFTRWHHHHHHNHRPNSYNISCFKPAKKEAEAGPRYFIYAFNGNQTINQLFFYKRGFFKNRKNI